jgi:kynureninase
MDALIEKSKKLTGYLEFVIQSTSEKLEIITPKENRGCQLSIIAHGMGKTLHDKLTAAGVISDWREPNVIRCAPVPLYNSFEDVFRLGEVLKSSLI